ncbi:hypothetical protein BDQ17DRAFT_1414684 [Cyathus striatus]|nr:hypothetical protein BDQ17DRAFT_1414684 [Cyathus striatus]
MHKVEVSIYQDQRFAIRDITKWRTLPTFYFDDKLTEQGAYDKKAPGCVRNTRRYEPIVNVNTILNQIYELAPTLEKVLQLYRPQYLPKDYDAFLEERNEISRKIQSELPCLEGDPARFRALAMEISDQLHLLITRIERN